jgi:hypothetical protein
MRTFARDAFSHDTWAGLLFSLSFRMIPYEPVRAAAADDPKKVCQALFYQGQALLTEGDRTAAEICFRACDPRAESAEAHMAPAEVKRCEPLKQTVERAIVRLGMAVKERLPLVLRGTAGFRLRGAERRKHTGRRRRQKSPPCPH